MSYLQFALDKGLNVISPHSTTWLFKINDPLVLVQGQKEEQRPSRLSTRSKGGTTTLSSWYKVKRRNNDPVVLVQGLFKVRDPLVLVQASIYIYFITFYFQPERN